MSSRRPLRIACLHGYRQNAQRFRHKTGGLRKSLERNINLIRPSSHSNSVSQTPSSDRLALAELVYIDAPFVVEKVLHQDPATDTPPRERVVFSPNIIVSNASRDPNDPTRNKNVKDLTQRTWWEIEGRIYAGWDQSKEYLRAQFAEKVTSSIKINHTTTSFPTESCPAASFPNHRTSSSVFVHAFISLPHTFFSPDDVTLT